MPLTYVHVLISMNWCLEEIIIIIAIGQFGTMILVLSVLFLSGIVRILPLHDHTKQFELTVLEFKLEVSSNGALIRRTAEALRGVAIKPDH